MSKKYKTIRFPIEAKQGFINKKIRIEEKIKKLTGKPRRISLAETLRFFANRENVVYDDEIINHFYRKRKKNTGGMIV